MHYPALAQRVRYFKENEEGMKTMCKIYDEIREYGREQTAILLIKNGRLPLDEIAAVTQLPMEVVIQLDAEHGTTAKPGLLPRIRRAWNHFRTK